MARMTILQGNEFVGSDNPFEVRQAQLTAANDEVRANQYVQSDGEWIPRRWPNATAPHQNLTLANGATSNIVTTAQGGGGNFAIHELLLFSTIGGVFSLFDGVPNGTVNLLARLGIAANTVIVKNFKGLVQVTGPNHLVLRNDTGSTAAITTQTDIEILT